MPLNLERRSAHDSGVAPRLATALHDVLATKIAATYFFAFCAMAL